MCLQNLPSETFRAYLLSESVQTDGAPPTPDKRRLAVPRLKRLQTFRVIFDSLSPAEKAQHVDEKVDEVQIKIQSADNR